MFDLRKKMESHSINQYYIEKCICLNISEDVLKCFFNYNRYTLFHNIRNIRNICNMYAQYK